MDKHLSAISRIVRRMTATGEDGFEGLVGRCLESLVGVPFRLSSSGSQRGLDGTSVGDGAVVFEAKRYEKKLPRESVLTKLVDTANNCEEIDLWILAATTGVSAQLDRDIAREGDRQGLATLILDWPDVNCPPLAMLLAMAEPAVMSFFAPRDDDVDLSALAAALADMRARSGFGPQSAALRTKMSEPTVGFPLAQRAATERLRRTFSDERMARQFLKQSLAPLSPLAHCIRRGATSDKVTNALCASSDKLTAVIGAEGNGKSWVVADAWARLREPPLTAFVPGEVLAGHRAADASKVAMELLLHASGSDEGWASRKRWERVWERWKRLGRSPIPRFLLIADGLNQHPTTEWGSLCDALSREAYDRGGQLVVTCRDAFFHARIRPKLAMGANVVSVPEWTDGERDVILIEHGLNPNAFMPTVRPLLRNPRILAVALALHSAMFIESLEELSVSRLLFEHLRLADEDSDVSLTAAEFSGRLRKLAEQALERVKADVVDDIFVFEGDLNAASEGRFFQPIDNEQLRYKLLDDGADLALGLALKEAATSAERNSRNIAERLASVLEPVAALDKTANALFAAVTVACLDESVSERVCSALIGALFHVQNIDERFFAPLSSLVQRRVQPFLAALENDAERLTSGDLGRCLVEALRRARSRPDHWATMSAPLSRWLRSYTLAPTGRYANGRQSTQEKRSARAKERAEIDARVEALGEQPREVLSAGNLDDGFERVAMSKLAFSLMAGMPLASFAGELVAWRLAAALRPSFDEPTTEFAHLISFNVIDWSETRQALVQECEVLRGDTAEASQWALRGVLDAMGEAIDAADAEQIRRQLIESHERPEWMRSRPRLSEPYDPASKPTTALDAQLNEYKALAATALRTQMGTTSDDWTFTKLGPVIARFATEAGVAKIEELNADVLKRSGLPLRQGLLELRRHNMLIGREEALRLAQRVHNGLAASICNLSENDQLIVAQYHLLLAFPQLSAEEQVALMATPQSTTNFLLELLPQVKPLTIAEFERRFETALRADSRVELYVLLAFAASTELPISTTLHASLLDIALGEDAELRGRAQALILANDAPDLLRDFEASGWTVRNIENEHSNERWLGSWILIEAAKWGFGNDPSVLSRIEKQLCAAAALHLSGRVAEEAALIMDAAFKKAAGLSQELVAPDLEFSHGSRVERAMPRFRISPPPQTSESLIEALASASESTDDFEKRQEGALTQFSAFKQILSKNDAHLVLESTSIGEMKALLVAQPSLLADWTQVILHYPAANLNALHNFGVTLAEAIMDEKPALAQELLQRLSQASPYARQMYLGRQVELPSHAIWNAPEEAGLREMQYARLDAATNDYEIAAEVLAALDAGRADTLERYISDRIDSGLPSRVARALTASGFSLPSAFNEATLRRFDKNHGMLGTASLAAHNAYERHVWAEHWYGEMLNAEGQESLWRATQLFRECVDARFEVLREKAAVGREMYELYNESVYADLHNLYTKRANDRKKTLFGAKVPSTEFLGLGLG